MRRIGLAVVLTLSLTLGLLVAEPQQTEKVRRIGFLSATMPGSEVEDAFRQGLREHGYIEGQNRLLSGDSRKAEMIRSPGSLRNSLLRRYLYPFSRQHD